MRRKKILCVALAIAALSTVSVWKASAATPTEMPSGTVVIGGKAFDLGYANDSKNLTEITSLIVAGGAIYVKGFDAVWIDNTTNKVVNSSAVPGVTYKSSSGIEVKYAAGDKVDVATDEVELEVVLIE